MASLLLDIDSVIKEVRFTTSRSGGPGGQGVNKVNTKVTLRWDVLNSVVIDDDQKEIILLKLCNAINKDGELVISSESSRSQLQNKEDAKLKLKTLIKKAFFKPKKRKPTKPSKSSVKKRLNDKKRLGKKKKLRKDFEDE